MNLNIHKMKMDFNYGIGMYPISIFVDLSAPSGVTEERVRLDVALNGIEHLKCRDVVVYGAVEQQLNEVNWLNSRLISTGYHVTVLSNTVDPIIASRLVNIISDPRHLKNGLKNKMITAVSPRDILMLYKSDIKALIVMRNILVEYADQVKSKVMLVDTTMNSDEYIKAGLLDIEPYWGKEFWA